MYDPAASCGTGVASYDGPSNDGQVTNRCVHAYTPLTVIGYASRLARRRESKISSTSNSSPEFHSHPCVHSAARENRPTSATKATIGCKTCSFEEGLSSAGLVRGILGVQPCRR